MEPTQGETAHLRAYNTHPLYAGFAEGAQRVVRPVRTVIVLAMLTLLAGCGKHEASGPVFSPWAKVVDFPRLAVGTTFTDGLVQLVDGGSEPAVIDSVAMVNTTTGMQFLGAKIAGRHRRYGEDEILMEYPPTARALGPVVPAIGATIAPGRLGDDLLVGLKITKPGVQIRGGVEVGYHVGADHYSYYAPVAVVNCPRGQREKHCNAVFKASKGGF